MTVNEAVKQRVEQLLIEKNMTRYKLAMNCGVPHATLKNIMNNLVDNNLFSTILLISYGFGIKPKEFVDSPLFDEENLNI